MRRKLFVLSMDAMVHEDVAKLAKKPNFARIMNKRAEVERVLSVYPASTYPAHTTLMTGCTPAKHGVWNNFPLKVENDGIPHWPLYHKLIDAEDIFAAAKRVGCTTAAVFWPITGCNPNIDHIINEYFFYYPEDKKDIEGVFRRMGADDVAIQAVRENIDRFPFESKGGLQIDSLFDNFINGCTCSLIRSVQPDVLLVHNCWLDSLRHANGVFAERITEALDDMDNWLGEIIEAMEDAGVYENTDFVILSDHGQRNYSRTVSLNLLLKQGGFIDMAPDGNIYDWRAFAQSNGGSATIYLGNDQSAVLHQRVKEYLEQLKNEGNWGIREVYTREETLKNHGLYGPFSFMVEAESGTAFSGSLKGDVVNTLAEGVVKAGHGYEPQYSAQPVFLASGKSFKEGAVLETARLIDIAPTLAAVLGTDLPQAEGRIMHELLK